MGMTTEQIAAVVKVLRGHAEHFTAMARKARTNYLHASSPYETGKLEGIAYGLETAAAALEAVWLRINNDEPSRENEPPPDSWVRDRYGTTYHRNPEGVGWGCPGFLYGGVWEQMWDARGPFTLCGPWGLSND